LQGNATRSSERNDFEQMVLHASDGSKATSMI